MSDRCAVLRPTYVAYSDGWRLVVVVVVVVVEVVAVAVGYFSSSPSPCVWEGKRKEAGRQATATSGILNRTEQNRAEQSRTKAEVYAALG